MEKEILEGFVLVKVGDITDEEVDAIVNAANPSLMGGGGVDGAIHRKGGPSILEECKKIRQSIYPDGLPVGKAVSTNAGNLKAKYVIHTVGPVWFGGNNSEEKLLQDAYVNSIKLAEELGCQTIAFPSISTGAYGYPKEEAAKVVYRVLKDYSKKSKLKQIRLVFFSQSDFDTFMRIVEKDDLV
ncbi:MAG: O-acetyl-ADP-ribose deacetylase [Brevinematia bacterium]